MPANAAPMANASLVAAAQAHHAMSVEDAETSLQIVMQVVAGYLDADDRLAMANEVPDQWQAVVAQAVPVQGVNDIGQLAQRYFQADEQEVHARISAAWLALKSLLPEDRIRHIKRAVPNITFLLLES